MTVLTLSLVAAAMLCALLITLYSNERKQRARAEYRALTAEQNAHTLRRYIRRQQEISKDTDTQIKNLKGADDDTLDKEVGNMVTRWDAGI